MKEVETTRPELGTEEKTEIFGKKVEWWIKYLGEYIEENYFYRLLEKWLKDVCQSVEIYLDENPFISALKIGGTSYIYRGRAHYINKIKCDNNMYEFDIEYEFYEFIDQHNGDITTVIDKLNNVSVRKIGKTVRE